MLELLNFIKDNFIDIGLLSIIILSGIVVLNIFNEDNKSNKKIKKIVTIEALESKNNNSQDEKNIDEIVDDIGGIGNELTDLLLNNDSPCINKKYGNVEINEYCSKHFNTRDTCTANSCCIWLNGKKCVGGSSRGPIFYGTDDNPLNIEHYSYKNECYDGSKKCPKNNE